MNSFRESPNPRLQPPVPSSLVAPMPHVRGAAKPAAVRRFFSSAVSRGFVGFTLVVRLALATGASVQTIIGFGLMPLAPLVGAAS